MVQKSKAPSFTAMLVGMLAGTWGSKGVRKAFRLNGIHSSRSASKYQPHQGAQECARRVRQMEAGKYDVWQVQR